MREVELTLPKLGLIAGTRAMLGAGIGLLVAPRLSGQQRRAVGWTLLLVGIVTTIPLVAEVFGNRASSSRLSPIARTRATRRRLAEAAR
jgi:uncharacterized membrane protein YfcA